MATPHISAEPGQIAPLVLMPGDPRRAEKIAHAFLSDVEVVSDVRGIAAHTGTYEGTPVTVMASGMGLPSISIYATELFRFYGVHRIVRVGTCGAFLDDVRVNDVVIATAAHTDSSVPTLLVDGIHLALAPSFPLLRAAAGRAEELGLRHHVGPVLSSDHFYIERPGTIAALERLGTLAVEMEAHGLYAVAYREGGQALTVLTVSDHLKGGQDDLSAAQREDAYQGMVEVALAALRA